MIYIVILLVVPICIISSPSKKFDSPFPTPLLNLESEHLLLALEAEITKTLRNELATDDELQYLDSGAGSGQEPPTTKVIPTTSTPTTIITTIATTTTTKATPKYCVPAADCSGDKDCPLGQCLGSELGICDCNACIANSVCSSDSDCGGLRNSCNSKTGLCDCVKAFHSHGYTLFIKVLLTFCHQTKCTPSSDSCFGLPCRTGKCRCPQSQQKSNLPIHYFTG